MKRPITSRGTEFDGRAYQARFDELVRQGADVHGEADLLASYAPTLVLDAGCGTGRVAIELWRRGLEVVGVDRDGSMLAEARRLGPDLEWIQADLSSLALGRRFPLVVMAGNVPLFTPAEARDRLVQACAGHVSPGGRLIAGFQLDQGYDLSDYDRVCAGSGLALEDRWSTWARQPYHPEDGYAVSVHLLPSDR